MLIKRAILSKKIDRKIWLYIVKFSWRLIKDEFGKSFVSSKKKNRLIARDGSRKIRGK